MGLKKMNALASIIAIALLNESNRTEILTPSPEPKKKIIPKGCKEYWFDENGNFAHTSYELDNKYYCIASSDKVAIKKFNKYKPKLQHKEDSPQKC